VLSSYLVLTFPKKSSATPNFVFIDTNGNQYNLSDFFGKVIVIDFMAMWCKPCIKMIENLKEVHKKFPQVVMISIDIDSTDNIEEFEDFKNSREADRLFTVDNQGIGKKYDVVSLPKTVVITPLRENSVRSYRHHLHIQTIN